MPFVLTEKKRSKKVPYRSLLFFKVFLELFSTDFLFCKHCVEARKTAVFMAGLHVHQITCRIDSKTDELATSNTIVEFLSDE